MKKTSKTTKKAKKKAAIITDHQIEMAVDKFYDHVYSGILDAILMPYEKSEEITNDMSGFLIDRAYEELKLPCSDEVFEAKIEEIMKEEVADMSKDLILHGAKCIIEEMEEEKNECPIHGKKPPKKGDFNSSRGLN